MDAFGNSILLLFKSPQFYGRITFHLQRLHSTVMTLVLVRVMQALHKGQH